MPVDTDKPETERSIRTVEATLQKQADRIAKQQETAKGIPYNVTYDRLTAAPSWREKEIDYLRTQTQTPKAEVEKVIREAGGVDDGGLEAARSTLINRQRRQARAEAKAAKEQQEMRQADVARTKQAEAVEAARLESELVRGAPKRKKEDVTTPVPTFEQRLFEKRNTKLPDEQYVSKVDLAAIKKTDPDIYKVFKTKGLVAGNKELASKTTIPAPTPQPKTDTKPQPGKEQESSVIKSVWRSLTPWDEDAGETYLKYLSESYKASFTGKIRTSEGKFVTVDSKSGQKYLKEMYSQQKGGYKDTPLWARVFLEPQHYVIKQGDLYVPVVAGVAPVISGGGKKVVTETAKKVAKTAVKDGVDFNKLLKEVLSGRIKTARDAVKWAKAQPKPKPITKQPLLAKGVTIAKGKGATVTKGKGITVTQGKATQMPMHINDWKKKIDAARGIKSTPTLKTFILPKLNLNRINKLSAFYQPAAKAQERLQLLQLNIEQLKPTELVKLRNLTKQQNVVLTDLQSDMQARNITATILSNAVQNTTQEQTQTEAKAQMKQLIDQQVKDLPTSKLKTKVQQLVKVAEKTAVKPTLLKPLKLQTPAKPPTTKVPPPPAVRLPKFNKSEDKSRRKKILASRGAIAWRQGELHGKDRWDVVTSPYTREEDYTIVLGRKPQGAMLIKGPKSAFRTAQTIYGQRLKRPTVVNQPGLFATTLTPSGSRRINLTFNKDINLTKKIGSLEGKGRVFPLP